MRQLTSYILGLFVLTTACGQVNDKTNTPQTTPLDSIAGVLTFYSKTEDYFIKIQLQFADTTLIKVIATGNCDKKCNFSFGGQPKQIGKTQNVSLPNGNNVTTTEYAYVTDDCSLVFEIPDNHSRIKLMGLQNADKKCEECFHDIIMGQLITPLQKQ